MINLRRNPLFGIGALVIGTALLVLGLFYQQFWVVFAGVLHIGIGVLILLTPILTIEQDEVIVKNIFGQPRARYPHSGVDTLSIRDGKLVLRHGALQATLPRPSKSRLHPGDWRFLETAIAAARQKKNP